MSNPEFVYTTYISTTPERLWKALTDPAFTRRYWGLAFETDWQAGSPMSWDSTDGVAIADPDQVVLESDRTGGCPTPGTPSPPSGPSTSGSATSRSPWPPSAIEGDLRHRAGRRDWSS